MTTGVRVALYARVSTEEQTKKYGLDAQLTALRARARDRGYTIQGEYVDAGVSGGTLDRPELTRLRDAVKRGLVDVVLIPDPTRLSRAHHEQIGLRVELRKRVRVEWLTLPDGDSAAHELLENITSAVGQFEKSEIRRKTHGGRLRRAAAGKRGAGRPAFGIRIAKDGTQEPDPATAPVVRRLFTEYAAGDATLSSLLRELANLGLRAPRGGAWSMPTLHGLLTNRVYVGEGIFNKRRNRGLRNGEERDQSTSKRETWNPEKDWVRFAVPPIVSVDLFDRVAARLKANAKERAGVVGSPTYTLRRLLYCPVCRRVLVAQTVAKRYRYYTCQARGGCGRRLSAPVVEAAFRSTFRTILSNPALLESKLRAEDLRRGAMDVELRSAVDHAQALATRVDKEVANLEDMMADPDLRLRPGRGETSRREGSDSGTCRRGWRRRGRRSPGSSLTRRSSERGRRRMLARRRDSATATTSAGPTSFIS